MWMNQSRSIDKIYNIDKVTITKILTLRDKLSEDQMYCPMSIGNTKRVYFNDYYNGEDIGIEKSEVVALEQEGFIKILSDLNKATSENNWGCLIELTEKTIKFEDYNNKLKSKINKECFRFWLPNIISTCAFIISILTFIFK